MQLWSISFELSDVSIVSGLPSSPLTSFTVSSMASPSFGKYLLQLACKTLLLRLLSGYWGWHFPEAATPKGATLLNQWAGDEGGKSLPPCLQDGGLSGLMGKPALPGENGTEATLRKNFLNNYPLLACFFSLSSFSPSLTMTPGRSPFPNVSLSHEPSSQDLLLRIPT